MGAEEVVDADVDFARDRARDRDVEAIVVIVIDDVVAMIGESAADHEVVVNFCSS